MALITPFLKGISTQLRGRRARSEQDELRDRIEKLRQNSLRQFSEIFGPWLPDRLFDPTQYDAKSRRRLFPFHVTFWAFLCQVLNPHSSCREVVRMIQAWHSQRGLDMPDSGTSAYCQARKRLPLQLLQDAHQSLTRELLARTSQSTRWLGHRLLVVDGTGLSMPDTSSNQKTYPQPSNQKKGCGFPVMKVVGVFCLQSGALLRWAQGTLKEGENRLFASVLGLFKPNDLVLADQGFSGYGQLAALKQRSVHALVRLHPRRKVDWSKGPCLGRKDRLVTWKRPTTRATAFDKTQWKELPQELTVRVVHIVVETPGFRTRQFTLVTTLLDPKVYSAEELGRLYFRRWTVEVFYRDVKQTMAMDVFRCQSPDMIDKEIHMHAIAYNLIRGIMGDIAATYHVDVNHLSFKGTLDALRQWTPLLQSASKRPNEGARILLNFYESIAEDPLIIRPERSEPRAKKRRPKPYRLLTEPRHQMKVELSRRKKIKIIEQAA